MKKEIRTKRKMEKELGPIFHVLQRRISRVDGGVVPADEDIINWPTSVSRLDGVLDQPLRGSKHEAWCACMRCYAYETNFFGLFTLYNVFLMHV
jgi:hypothetical protein